jgi:prepilin-type N-terminal cleavage/methylation domain-containing protein
MESYRHKTGITLVEMLIVVVIIGILATMVVGIATRIDNQNKEKLTKNIFAMLNGALEQFRDYGYNYNPIVAPPPERDFYRGLDFPLDCNGLILTDLQMTLEITLGYIPGSGSVLITPSGVLYDPNYSGSEVLYFFLSRVPASRKALEKIDISLITNFSVDKQPMEVSIDVPGSPPQIVPFLRIIDPWGTTLRYDYYDELVPDPILRDKGKRAFPLITSAGPDRIFGTGDDITNK